MSQIHLNRILSALEKLFSKHIDMSDIEEHSKINSERVFRSRAIAAYAISLLAGTDTTTSGNAVTDGFDDNGIDALYYDRADKALYIVQSKLIANGDGSIQHGDAKKLLDGFRDLVRPKLDHFNDRIRNKESQVMEALKDSEARFVLVLAYTGSHPLSEHVRRDIERLKEEINDISEVLSVQVLDQKRLYEAISGHAQRPNINLEISLHEWGYVNDPYPAVYGQVLGSQIAEWWGQYGRNLFTQNIRSFKGSTDVNEALAGTLCEKPDDFWYFNNGITLLCSRIAKPLLGGASRGSSVFDCREVAVVNGAQTVGIIGMLSKERDLSNVKVLLRIISLEECPSGFDKEVTRATNTQNRIENRDFAALDPNQRRLSSELALDGINYVYRSGEPASNEAKACSITDATVALACAHTDIEFAVQSKREIGRLWQSIEQPPYTSLFNEQTTACELWNAVEIMRCVDRYLKALGSSLGPREEMVSVHGNRLILHFVFMHPELRAFRDHKTDISRLQDEIHAITKCALGFLCQDIAEHNSSTTYLASFFKNMNKCRESACRVLAHSPWSREGAHPRKHSVPSEAQRSLF